MNNYNELNSVDTDKIAHILLKKYKLELSKERRKQINGYGRYLQRNKNDSNFDKGK